MKAILLLALVVAASAATVNTDISLLLGYKKSFSNDKSGGTQFVSVTVLGAQLPPPGSGYSQAYLKWTPTDDSSSANAASSNNNYYGAVGAKPDVSASGGTTIGTKSATSGFAPVYWKIFDTFTSNTTGDATYWFGIVTNSCNLCLSTSDMNIGVWLVWSVFGTPSSADLSQPFMMQDNTYTDFYAVPAKSYGTSGIVTVTATTGPIYVKLSGPVSSGANLNTDIIVYTQGMPPAASLDPATITAGTTMTKYPLGSATSGSIDTGAVTLGAGTWYITPYCSAVGSIAFSTCNFNFAVGLGHEPSGVSALSASFTMILLSFAALFGLKML